MSLFEPTTRKRALFFVACDYLVFAAAMFGAFAIRFDGRIPEGYWRAITTYLLIALPPMYAANVGFRLYRLTWRFVGARDLVNVLVATMVGTLGFVTLAFLLREPLGLPTLPRSVLLLFFLLSFLGVSALRMGKRFFLMFTGSGGRDRAASRVLVVGAGRTGEQLLREMTAQPGAAKPVAAVDDDPLKHDSYLHGVRIFGGCDRIPQVVLDERIDQVIVAMPSAHGHKIREVVVAAREAGVPSVRIMPDVEDLLEGRVTLAGVRDVRVEDLLGREPVELDVGAIGEMLYGGTVLVTGAAGSVGSELARQIARFEPGRLVLLEKDETRLFTLDQELRRTFHRVPLFAVVGDVRDWARVEGVFATFSPQVVFHAAAYKHVPMMEAHPQEAVTTNVLGTKVVAEVAAERGASVFVLISTDKAVNPTSVMGASKRAAEMVVRALDASTATRYVSVRFGNVLGSRGSLLPVVEEQIRRGGPITVTDPEMERYFMTVTEAAQLILKVVSFGDGGEVFALDMGDRVNVLELVEAMIRLSGLEPDVDVPIQFTGIRPGEKLKEELHLAEQGTQATSDEKIVVAIPGPEPDPETLDRYLELLADAAAAGDAARIRALFGQIVPTYRPVPGGAGDDALATLLEVPDELEGRA